MTGESFGLPHTQRLGCIDISCSSGWGNYTLPRMQLQGQVWREGVLDDRSPLQLASMACWGFPGLVLDLAGGPNSGSALTCSILQGWGSCGLSSPSLAFLQGTALVIHTTALELTQQVKETLLVRGRGPGNALGGEGDINSALCASAS